MAKGYPDYRYFSFPVAVNEGGTGATSFTLNGVLIGNATSAFLVTAAGAANEVLRVPAAGGTPAFGALDLSQAAAVTGLLPVAKGGTGVTEWDGARVYNSAVESIPTATLTALTFNSERYDNGGLHSTTTNTSRLTAQKAGKYLITGHLYWAYNATGLRRAYIRLNGATFIAAVELTPGAAGENDMSVVTVYHLAAADYVELVVVQNSGGNLNVAATGNYSPEFAMQWVGP
jgi:hypothetical protein